MVNTGKYQAISLSLGKDHSLSLGNNSGVTNGRARSSSQSEMGSTMLMPEIGTASDQTSPRGKFFGSTVDDMYIENVPLQRRFVDKFVAYLEDDARKIFCFGDADFDEGNVGEREVETGLLRPASVWLKPSPSPRKEGSVARVVIIFVKGMVGSYILYTPKVCFDVVLPNPILCRISTR
ncbi:unnamed protein product [Choristocarpus tenellus]